MDGFIRDEELEKMITEVNSQVAEGDGPAVIPAVDHHKLTEIRDGEPLEAMLSEMIRRQASDLLLVPGSPPTLRINGVLEAMAEDALEKGQVERLFAEHLGTRSRRNLNDLGNADFSLRLLAEGEGETAGGSAWRLRVNLQRQRGDFAAGVRLLPQAIPNLRELNLPEGLVDLVLPDRGFVLVSGPTGSGKSTTLAALVDALNRSRGRHIITIEDPVEYQHRSLQSLVEQIEIGSDAPDFASALRAALRRDPDVLLVGELRDLETVSVALTAAETGHLVLGTLHTGDATHAVTRIIDVFPSQQQSQVRQQLALALNAVVCQQLVPLKDGPGRVPALEILVATYAVRNTIRKQHEQRLYNEMISGRHLGMQLMEDDLARLVSRGLISVEEAMCRANRPDELERRLTVQPG